MIVNVPQCEWVTDGWPHRQCQKRGTHHVQSAYATFPNHFFCARHARIVEAGRCDDCFALRGEQHNEKVEH